MDVNVFVMFPPLLVIRISTCSGTFLQFLQHKGTATGVCIKPQAVITSPHLPAEELFGSNSTQPQTTAFEGVVHHRVQMWSYTSAPHRRPTCPNHCSQHAAPVDLD